MIRKCMIFLFLISLFTIYGWSQHGKLEGIVTDIEGNPLEKVDVTIVSVKSSGNKIEVKTNKKGKFSNNVTLETFLVARTLNFNSTEK